MTTLRIILLTMAVVPVILLGIALWKPSKRKPKSEPQKQLSFFDKLLAVVGSDDIVVYNGVTYSQSRNALDADEQPLKLGTDKWFKIKVGRYLSGYGDWGGGFDRESCAVAEVYIGTDGRVLHVCAGSPYYNSPTKEADEKLHEKVQKEIDEIKLRLSSLKCVMLRTNDPWLRGVLETIHIADLMGEADLWKHCIHIEKRK